MKVIVCCKAVPTGISKVTLEKTEGKVEYESYSMIMNESDECALEEALIIKEMFGAEIIVITVGGLKSQEILYQALAKGADRVIRIDSSSAQSPNISDILANAIGKMDYDLVLTGTESGDNMSAQTGVLLAERLNLPHAFAVSEVEIERERSMLKVTTELGQGVHAIIELALPAVLCVQSSTRAITIASVMKLLQARRKGRVESMTADSSGIETTCRLRIVEVFDPPNSECEIIPGSPLEIAGELIRRIYAVSG